MNKLIIAALGVIGLVLIMIEDVYATGGPPPSPADAECASYVDHQSDAHMLTVNPTTVLPGGTVTATATVTDTGTGANRIRFVWIDDATNTIVQTNLYTRGNDNPPWSRQDTFTIPSTAKPGDSFTVVACFETPNNTIGKGVTHHVNVGAFMVVPELLLGSIGLAGSMLGTFYLYRKRSTKVKEQ